MPGWAANHAEHAHRSRRRRPDGYHEHVTDSADDIPAEKRRYRKGIARRQEILDKAIEVFAQRGSQKTSLRAIAQEVGVTHAALTHYFGSLEELLVEVYRESERGPADPVAPPEEPLSPALSMRRSAEANRAVPGLVQLYSTLVSMGLESNHPVAHEFAASRFARIRERIAGEISELQNSGAIRPDLDPDLTSALIIAASDGLQTQWLLDDSVDHESALEMLDLLLRTPKTD